MALHQLRYQNARQEKRSIKRQPAAHNIRSNAPERGTETETDEKGAGCVADFFFRDVKLGGEGGEGEGDALEPEVVGEPAETAKDEELPVVAAHANVLNCFVDYFTFHYRKISFVISLCFSDREQQGWQQE